MFHWIFYVMSGTGFLSPGNPSDLLHFSATFVKLISTHRFVESIDFILISARRYII